MNEIVRKSFRCMAWAITRILRRSTISDYRDILLCCNDPLMADFLGPFWKLFSHDRRLRGHFVFLGEEVTEQRMRHMRKQLPVREVGQWWAYTKAWDLVVCADHCFGDARRRSPAVFIGHGLPGKCISGSSMEYAYGPHVQDARGRILYKRIFTPRESDAAAAIAGKPAMKDVIVAVGDLQNDVLLAQTHLRDQFREQLGVKREHTVVFVLSTWGEHCLWHTVGDGLLQEAEKLQNEFTFVLSAHPHEYRPKPNGERVWGEHLRSQRARGFIVREPSEDWIPYMVASDVVVSDYTNLVQSAALLHKPIILTPVPEDCIWKDSITWKIREFAPIMEDPHLLRQHLLEAKEHYPMDKLRSLALLVHPQPGRAADKIRKEIYGLLKLEPAESQADGAC